MLVELAAQNLGVIEDVRVVLGAGMTALTGETGAGKTLIVEAIELLVGGRAEQVMVRPGADEAVVEGRFVRDGEEVVLTRVLPRDGRSRAYVDGRLATAAMLNEVGGGLVDLHGQHAHQSLLSMSEQRAALDRFGRVDLTRWDAARSRVTEVERALGALGGEVRARAREIDLLRYQLDELDRAGLADADEDGRLEAEEEILADAAAHREAAARAASALRDDGGALDALGTALASLGHRAPFASLLDRLRSLVAETDDIADELRAASEGIADDPERLEQIRARRHLLRELRRKYGDTLADVLAHRDRTAVHLDELVSHDERAATLDAELTAARADERRRAVEVGAARRAAAPGLAAAVTAHLADLAMPRARVEVRVDGLAGDEVVFLLAANAGEPALPLAKVASGGELARAMLALRLVTTHAPPTLVFDEVDAGIGGQAALSIGRALRALGTSHQVLVVTHLAQVAAHADDHWVVTKHEAAGRTVSRARRLAPPDRLEEISRMLSGMGDSPTGRRHAKDLLAAARRTEG